MSNEQDEAAPMSHEQRLWLQTLIAACDSAASDIRDDPSSRLLLVDIEALRVRLNAELHSE